MLKFSRASDEYEDDVDEFIAFALAPLMDKTSIRCPCISCKNFNHLSPNIVKDHLIIEGIDMTYDPFVLHGEEGQVHVVDEGVETIDFNLTETYEMLKATNENWLKHSMKFSYMGSRRFLPDDHPYRLEKSWFNGKQEHEAKPVPLKSDEIFTQEQSIFETFKCAAMLTFEALSETSEFARKWVPFCKKFNIEPRAPEWYFSQKIDYLKDKVHPNFVRERRAMKREYGGFKVQINSLVDMAKKVPKEGWTMQDGMPWPGNNVRDHPGMIHISVCDVEGNELPRRCMFSREKKPGFDHHKKARGNACSATGFFSIFIFLLTNGCFDILPDESFTLKHDGRGYLSMLNTGPKSNNSQFFITFIDAHHLDGLHVVFRMLVQGRRTLKKIESAGSKQGEPAFFVKIVNCGELLEGKIRAVAALERESVSLADRALLFITKDIELFSF
ncbi:hypothetical protein IFM89_033705 [Coptis chinensis]|uniref:PPIase cyclophilin-type domain-containing protein n=1 Tax=Coptis chinensis TaxID=261450 RepID=A0A835HLJ1_9MAGN|nr:hypothetical protein IFM89_033705 [Coptis chinensis]